mmetsp:Transcript_3475/g.6907  ORF Transcript_3475/g.6907 Transcript_3475/m.6907 type:complete len:191 (-) Transcript_3475:7-579(-)
MNSQYHPMPFWKAVAVQQQQQQQHPTTKDRQQQQDDTTEPPHSSHLTEQASWLAMFGTAYVFLYENACQTWTRSHRLALPPPSYHDDDDDDDDKETTTTTSKHHASQDESSPSTTSLDIVQVLGILLLVAIALFFIIMCDDELQHWDGSSLQWEDSALHDMIRAFVSVILEACRSVHLWFHPVHDIPLLQ